MSNSQNDRPRGAQPGAAQPIDPKKLAEKVYQLMLADLRIERARGARPARRRRKP